MLMDYNYIFYGPHLVHYIMSERCQSALLSHSHVNRDKECVMFLMTWVWNKARQKSVELRGWWESSLCPATGNKTIHTTDVCPKSHSIALEGSEVPTIGGAKKVCNVDRKESPLLPHPHLPPDNNANIMMKLPGVCLPCFPFRDSVPCVAPNHCYFFKEQKGL